MTTTPAHTSRRITRLLRELPDDVRDALPCAPLVSSRAGADLAEQFAPLLATLVRQAEQRLNHSVDLDTAHQPAEAARARRDAMQILVTHRELTRTLRHER